MTSSERPSSASSVSRPVGVPPRPVLTARERLVQSSEPSRDPPSAGGSRPPGGQPPEGGPSRRPGRPPRQTGARRRAGGKFRWVGRLIGALAGLIVLGGVACVIVLYGAYRHYASDLPDLEGLRVYQPKMMSRVYAADGKLVSEMATERRIFVPFSAIPDLVKQAFVSAEDQHFWTHPGVDPVAVFRAGLTDLEHLHDGRRPIGASTITQQVAKNMVLGNEVTMARKVKEAILALRIEESLSKQRILELYLNEIYLGQGAYGVAAASQVYFNKPLDEITVPEAAFLAALPKAPNNYNPFRYPDVARGRRDWVLDRMAENHAISREQAESAKTLPVLPIAYRRPEGIPGAGYFAEEVRRKLIERFGADTTTQGGLSVRTSLDPALQSAADRSLHKGLIAYDQAHGGWRGAVIHLADTSLSGRQWEPALAKLPRQPGMLREWRLAVVLSVQPGEATVAWSDPPDSPLPTATPVPVHYGILRLTETKWARPVRDGKLGGVPRRMNDIVTQGDVVMVEPDASSADANDAAGRGRAEAPMHALLRQIPTVQGALVSLDPRSGRVLAMSGGWSFETSQFNRATQANRQPGSSFKPFVYLTALEQGIAPGQKFLDAPFVMNMGAAGIWRPNNYEMTFSGQVPLSTALQKSLNLVTLRVAAKVGMEAVAKTAMDFHMVESMPKVLPAALGAVDTTVLREAGAYASLAQGGRLVTPHLIDSVQDRDGHVIWRPDDILCQNCATVSSPAAAHADVNPSSGANAASPEASISAITSADSGPILNDNRNQVADAMSTFQIVTMMQNVVAHGTGYSASIGMGGRPIAGKTGTSQDFVDAWFGGFTPTMVTIVWIGFDNPASLGEHETGGALAAPVWRDYMSVALKDHPILTFPMPEGMTLVKSRAGWDALKPNQPDGGTPVSSSRGPSSQGGQSDGDSPPPSSSGGGGGLDSGMGGLY